MEAKEVKPAIRKIANLVYGIQLIRSCGFDERIIGETVKAIRSAIRQLLESNTISADDIIDGYKQIIEAALQQYGGNISKAARHLKIARSTLYRKMEEFGIS